MMYHLKRSLAGGESCSALSPWTSGAPAFCGVSGFPGCGSRLLSFLISSVIACFKPLHSAAAQRMQQPLDDTSEHVVHHVEIRSEGKDGHDHDDRGGLHLFP